MGSRKKNEMTWPLMWRNVSVTTLNTTLQLLLIYRLDKSFDTTHLGSDE